MVWCGVFVWEVHDECMLAPGRTSWLLGCGCWMGGAPPGARVDCWHTHTDLDNVTDAGLKDFSAAVGSSSTITTVELAGKCEWLVCSYEWARAL